MTHNPHGAMKPTYASLLLRNDDLMEKVETLATRLRIVADTYADQVREKIAADGVATVTGRMLHAIGLDLSVLCMLTGLAVVTEQVPDTDRWTIRRLV